MCERASWSLIPFRVYTMATFNVQATLYHWMKLFKKYLWYFHIFLMISRTIAFIFSALLWSVKSISYNFRRQLLGLFSTCVELNFGMFVCVGAVFSYLFSSLSNSYPLRWKILFLHKQTVPTAFHPYFFTLSMRKIHFIFAPKLSDPSPKLTNPSRKVLPNAKTTDNL